MSKLAFFRQSGWMVIATTAGGALMWLVHYVTNRSMPEAEYGVFTTLLQVLNIMTIPAIGLQLTFVQQSATAEDEAARARLAGTARALLKGTFLLWLAGVAAVWLFQRQILADYKIAYPGALWALVALGLTSLWSPVFMGILQGRQNFLWLGSASILNGATRFGTAILFVALLSMNSTGAMLAAVLGMVVAMAIAASQIRDVFTGPSTRFDWAAWLKRATPVTLGYGAATLVLAMDMIVVQKFFPDGKENGIYGAAGTIGRAVFFFLAPMTTVMFPKVAQSAARSENSSVLMQAMGATAFMGVGAALCCTFLAELPFRIGYKPEYAPAAKLLPLFAWCMLPLPLANVLVNNLLARERYGVVPWLVAIAAAYYFALNHVAQIQPQRFENIIWTLGGFGLLLLLVCLVYTWQDFRRLKAGATLQSVNA